MRRERERENEPSASPSVPGATFSRTITEKFLCKKDLRLETPPPVERMCEKLIKLTNYPTSRRQ